jgi:hypothetical protein
MPRRALGVLKNLGNWAKANTKKTILGKLKKGGKHDKENVSVVFTSISQIQMISHLEE